MPMMAITTNNSTRVNPERLSFVVFIDGVSNLLRREVTHRIGRQPIIGDYTLLQFKTGWQIYRMLRSRNPIS
jgi:hypothetical protein